MNEILNGFLVAFCIVVIYYHWFKFEMKRHFEEDLEAVKKKIEEARLAVAGSPDNNNACNHLLMASTIMRQVDESDWRSATSLDDLIALRRRLAQSQEAASLAVAACRGWVGKMGPEPSYVFYA